MDWICNRSIGLRATKISTIYEMASLGVMRWDGMEWWMMDAGWEMGNERYNYMIPYGYGCNEGSRDAKEQERRRKRGG